MLGPRLSLLLQQAWASRWHPLSLLLLPVSWVFVAVAWLRKHAYHSHLLKVVDLPVPVCVVGNVSAGGGGKTPLVVELCRRLRSRDLHVGIIARGYGGMSQSWPVLLDNLSQAGEVGDEAVVLRDETQFPVAAGPDRVASAQALLRAHPEVDVIVSDDGLQHWRLGRAFELLVEDAAFDFGNGRPLPAGPLREHAKRFSNARYALRKNAHNPEAGYVLRPAGLRRLGHEGEQSPDVFRNEAIHALVGIARPEGFLATLDSLGYVYEPCVFPDHHRYELSDLDGLSSRKILTTTKDAARLERFAGRFDIWVLRTHVELTPPGDAVLQQLVEDITHNITQTFNRRP